MIRPRSSVLSAAALALLASGPGCGTYPAAAAAGPRFERVRTWACAYASTAPAGRLEAYDLLIVDPDDPPDLTGYPGLVLAYLSVGEVNAGRPYFQRVPRIDENPNWPGAWRIDLRDGRWKELLRSEILPPLRRFDGLFLDTVDAAFVTRQEREMIDLVRFLREAMPGEILVANNPESLLPDLDVDGVMAEAVFTRIDFSTGRFLRSDAAQAEARARRYAGRKVLNLEYAADPELAEYAFACAERHGFVPHVTSRADLREPSPAPRRLP